MSFVPTLAHALADIKIMSLPKSDNLLVQREMVASAIRIRLDEMVCVNKTLEAKNVVDNLLSSNIKCDVSDVFYQSFASGSVDIIEIFKRYQTLSDEHIRHGLKLAVIGGQMGTIQYALEQAQQRWPNPSMANFQANKLIATVIDSHMFSSQNIHKVVQWLLPWNNEDLSFSVVRASMHAYKKTARLLLKHATAQLVVEQIGKNHDQPQMQWLMDLINQRQRTQLKKEIPVATHSASRKM